jgi:hypothetical protein
VTTMTTTARAVDRAVVDRAALARAVLAKVEQRTSARAGVESADRLLPVLPVVASVLPQGALRRGSTLAVTGSTSLVLALVAQASREGSWAAVVGLPGVGLLAAAQLGVDLSRLALVPQPGGDVATVLGALVDGVDIVVLGPGLALVDAERRRLMARARERGTVLISAAPWPGAQVVLTGERTRWTGLGAGDGYLRACELTVTRAGRGDSTGARLRVGLPGGPAVSPPWSPDVATDAPRQGQRAATISDPRPPLRLAG